MFAIIIMTLVLISFVSIISYSILSFNHNLSVNNDSMALDNELTLIKQTLISHAKAIVNDDEYALPYGIDNAESGYHSLPSGLGIPLINHKGLPFQYCPYGLQDDTQTQEALITQADGSSYSVATTTINDIEYATYSDQAPSFEEAPEIQGIIISKINNDEILCDDINFNSNTNTFYSKIAKVSVITKNEVKNYFRLNNLSGITEKLTLNAENIDSTLSAINNDTSNKDYILTLDESITLTSNYEITRSFNKRNNIQLDLNGFYLTGNKSITFKNVNVLINSDSATTRTTPVYPNLIFNDSNVSVEKVNIGGITATNSNVNISNSYIYSSNTQRTFKAINSKVVFDGANKIIINNSLSNEAILDLNGSNVNFNNDSVVSFAAKRKTPLHLIELNSTDLKLFGQLSLDSSNNYRATTPILINADSRFYLNGGTIDLLASNYSVSNAIEVYGSLVSGGSSSNQSTISTYININEGAKVDLQNISL